MVPSRWNFDHFVDCQGSFRPTQPTLLSPSASSAFCWPCRSRVSCGDWERLSASFPPTSWPRRYNCFKARLRRRGRS
jgi:hypothetical protein